MGINKSNKTDCDSATGDMNVNPAHFDTIMAELDEEAFSLFLFLCSNFSKEKLIESGDGYRLNINNRDFIDSLVDKPEYGDSQLGKSFDALSRVYFELPIWDKGDEVGTALVRLIDGFRVFQNGESGVLINQKLAPYYNLVRDDPEYYANRYKRKVGGHY